MPDTSRYTLSHHLLASVLLPPLFTAKVCSDCCIVCVIAKCMHHTVVAFGCYSVLVRSCAVVAAYDDSHSAQNVDAIVRSNAGVVVTYYIISSEC
jgi:hypothetical protein